MMCDDGALLRRCLQEDEPPARDDAHWGQRGTTPSLKEGAKKTSLFSYFVQVTPTRAHGHISGSRIAIRTSQGGMSSN